MTRLLSGVGATKFQALNVNHCDVKTITPDCDNECCAVVPCQLCLIFTDASGIIHYGTALLGEQQPSLITWSGDVFDFTVAFQVSKVDDTCILTVEIDDYPVYELEKCQGDPVCLPEDSVSYEGGTLEWLIETVSKRHSIVSDDCEEDCIECRCICNELCITWTKTTNSSEKCYCGPAHNRVLYDCGERHWNIIFVPDCPDEYGNEHDPVNIRVRIEKNESTGACEIILSVDGNDIDTILGVASTCRSVEFNTSYTDSADGNLVTVSTACSECGSCKGGPCTQGCCFEGNSSTGPDIIPFTITAPSCSDIDGFSSIFSQTIWAPGAPCGFCACFIPAANPTVTGQLCLPSLSMVTPCSIELSFMLSCNVDIDIGPNEDINDCGSRLILILEISGTDHPHTNPNSALEVECSQILPNRIYIRPTSVSCECGAGISATFDLSGIDLGCFNPTFDPACPSVPTDCCQKTSCSLGGAVLTLNP